MDQRIVDGEENSADQGWENTLRPKSFAEYPGQNKIKEKLQIFVQAATSRQEPLDHTLLVGPPGLGKTTLAHILAHEMAVPFVCMSGPVLDKKGDLAAILTNLQPRTLLFIDEIHRLNSVIEEYLYSAMEDYYIDIVTGDGLGARSMQFQLAPFTLVGATTRAGLLNAPFRDRFGIVERLNFYEKSDLVEIVKRSAKLLKVNINDSGAQEIANRCRRTPRVANRLLKRVRDYAQVLEKNQVDKDIAHYALEKLEVDQIGLDPMDRRILEVICSRFGGGPVGIETLSASLSEEKDTLEEVYEPFLLQEGLIQKTPRGRMVTPRAYKHLDLLPPSKKSDQLPLV